jgi:hypothetical protein
MPNTTATQTNHPATLRQINYLKALAARTGTSFTYPKTSRDASAEIKRLKAINSTGTTFAELATGPNCTPLSPDGPHTNGSAVHDFEITGYGSSARWA